MDEAVALSAYLAFPNLMNTAPELLDLAQRVAAHFKDTDAPLGELARVLIQKAINGR